MPSILSPQPVTRHEHMAPPDAAVPSCTKDQFHGREFFHGLGWKGHSFRKIQVHYIYCALYFCDYYISSTPSHQALDPGGWGPLPKDHRENENKPLDGWTGEEASQCVKMEGRCLRVNEWQQTESEKGGKQLREAKGIRGASGDPGPSGSITSYAPLPTPWCIHTTPVPLVRVWLPLLSHVICCGFAEV